MKRRTLLCRTLAASVIATPLSSWAVQGLEASIRQMIMQMYHDGRLSADERTAWVVSDMSTRQRLVAINATRPMQCASMVKPFVVQAYLMSHFLKDKKLYPLSPKVLEEMRGMIVDSNNEFTNRMFERLGGARGVQWILKKQAPDIFRHIQIVESIPAQGRTYRNRAAADDYDRFLIALWYELLPGADILKKMMRIPNHDRIRSQTQFVPQDAVVYDKTGSTSMLCGDTGIIACYDRRGNIIPYTITGIIEKEKRSRQYRHWISARSDVVRAVSDQVYLYFANHYRL